MRFLQLNLNHCEAAQSLLTQIVRENNVDVALLSEPYRAGETLAWRNDASKGASIWAVNGRVLDNYMSTATGFVRATISDITVYSCYIPPRFNIEEFKSIVDRLSFDAARHENVLIVGDFNAWAIDWGCPRTSNRGRVLQEALANLDVVLLNQGNAHTYTRNGYGSIIDIAFASDNIARRIKWGISSMYTHSDHYAMIIDYLDAPAKAVHNACVKVHGWKSSIFDREMFRACLLNERIRELPDEAANVFIKKISNACDMSMQRRKPGARKKSVYWWNQNIAHIRAKCIKARREYTRSNGSPYLQEILRLRRRELKNAIKNSKKDSFTSICDDLDNNPFGTAYKIVTKKLKACSTVTLTDPVALKKIVLHLFPPQRITTWNRTPPEHNEYFPPVSSAEIRDAASKLKDRKAPGLDGIPNTVVKEVALSYPEYIANLFNSCFEYSTFPSIWKRQKLVLIPKGNKPLDDPSAFRPICLLDSFGKLLECIICRRLQESVELARGLSDYQFGFRKHKSTMDAIRLLVDTAKEAIYKRNYSNDYCVVVTLDVKNAFNSANWSNIIQALRDLCVPGYLISMIMDYFTGRVLFYSTDEGLKKYEVTGGVPQGSVLGPLLWNVMYNGILKLDLPSGTKVIGFADDIAVTIVAAGLEEAKTVTNASIRVIKSWLTSMGLELAEHKSEAIVISSRRVREKLTITIGDCEVTTRESLKYLGMMIDDKLSFKSHINYVEEKARRSAVALCRIMPNTRGPKYQRRKVLAGVVRNIILYASPIWAESMRFKTYCDRLNSVYRLSALRVCSAYRTVSDEASFVIAGMIPVDLLAKETALIHKHGMGQLEARSRTLEEWQRRWSTTTKGRWTRTLIPNLNVWLERKHGALEFYTTQFLSGHGAYRQYLHRFGLSDTPSCPCCHDEIENAEHVFFVCPRFTSERTNLQRQVGITIEVGNIIGLMLSSPEVWGHIAKYVKLVLMRLAEPARQLG